MGYKNNINIYTHKDKIYWKEESANRMLRNEAFTMYYVFLAVESCTKHT